MKIQSVLLIGSGLGIVFISIPIFFLFFYLEDHFKDFTTLELVPFFVSGVITGIFVFYLVTKILLLDFSARTFFMGILAVPICSSIYGAIVILLQIASNAVTSSPMKSLDFLKEVKLGVFNATFVYGHIFFPLALIATFIAQWFIIREHAENEPNHACMEEAK